MDSIGGRRVVRVRVSRSGGELGPADAVGAVMPGGTVVLEWAPFPESTPGHVAVGPMSDLIARAASLDWWVIVERRDLTFEGLRGWTRLLIQRATDRHWTLELMGTADGMTGNVRWAPIPADDTLAYGQARQVFSWLLPRH